MLLYTIGAGITAAAGTRLALQLFIDGGFKIVLFLNISCQYLALQLFIDGGFKIVSFLNISCQYLTETASGNLRACCPPWW